MKLLKNQKEFLKLELEKSEMKSLENFENKIKEICWSVGSSDRKDLKY